MQQPAALEELTPNWLTLALRNHGGLRAATVGEVSIEPLDEGKGFFSRVARLRLEYAVNDEDAPRTLIAKVSSPTAEMRKRAATISAYEREVRFYQHLAHQITLPTPACFYADIDVETGHHVLLLEDLAPAQSGSRVAGCTPEQARVAIRQIATLHSEWWESRNLSELAWLRDSRFDHDTLVAAHAGWWPEFARLAGSRVPHTLLEIGERLGHHRAMLFQHLWNTPPRTLVHADYQLDNLLFGSPDEGGVPFAVIDWQSVSRRRGIWDVGLFLGQNLEPELRAEIELDLLAEYIDILAGSGVWDYSLDQCLLDYRLCLLQRYGALISTIAAMPFTKAQIQLHIDVLLPRIVAALLDHDAAALLA